MFSVVLAMRALVAGLPLAKIGTVTETKTLKVGQEVCIGLDALVTPFKETLHGV